MALVEINWKPSDPQLRQFSFICMVALPAVGWIWGGSSLVVAILGAVGAAFAIAGLTVPKKLTPVFLSLTIMTTPIGMVVGELAMLVIYFGIFLPFGIAFRIMKRDALQLTLDRQVKSYWQPKKQPNSMSSYFRQS